MPTHYETLGVAENASQDDIKKAFRKLAMQYHPDVNHGNAAAEAKFKEINEAYDTIGNPAKRQEYDNRRNFTGNPWSFNMNMNAGPGGLDDFINQFFGQHGFHNARQQAHPKNRDVTLSLTISLEDAYNGKSLPVQYNTPSGRRVDLMVNLPAGVEPGTRIRYQGQGDHANTNISPGDLYISIIINDHPIYERHGHDLHTRTTIDSISAIVGSKKRITCIDGQQLDLTIPTGTQPGTFFRIPGKGMPVRNQKDRKGDLFVHANIQTPTELTTEQLETLRQISEQINKKD